MGLAGTATGRDIRYYIFICYTMDPDSLIGKNSVSVLEVAHNDIYHPTEVTKLL